MKNNNLIIGIIAATAAAGYLIMKGRRGDEMNTPPPPLSTSTQTQTPQTQTQTQTQTQRTYNLTDPQSGSPYATPPPDKWQFLRGDQKMRNDAAGAGSFGASRTGGKKHKGVDLLMNKGATVYAPFAGKITRQIKVYTKYPKWKGVEIQSAYDKSIKVKIFYATPKAGIIGADVVEGQPIATGQGICEQYNCNTMKNHLHVELWENGTNKDITNYLNLK